MAPGFGGVPAATSKYILIAASHVSVAPFFSVNLDAHADHFDRFLKRSWSNQTHEHSGDRLSSGTSDHAFCFRLGAESHRDGGAPKWQGLLTRVPACTMGGARDQEVRAYSVVFGTPTADELFLRTCSSLRPLKTGSLKMHIISQGLHTGTCTMAVLPSTEAQELRA